MKNRLARGTKIMGAPTRFALAIFAAASLVGEPQSRAEEKTPMADRIKLRAFPAPLSSDLPLDVNVDRVAKLSRANEIIAAQREFDILSWQAFLALNWSSERQGKPTAAISNEGPRVWSFWRASDTIFLPDGAEPGPWDPARNLAESQELFRVKAAWRQGVTSADQNLQAFSGPLVDQNGKWVRYGVFVNRTEFDYLIENQLYNLDGQEAFSKREDNNVADFPANTDAKSGAIEIKLAWKELGPNDDPGRFYTSQVNILRSEPLPAGAPKAEPQTITAGLVGMHIAMRTRSAPEWVWGTFEQVDNVAVDPHARGKDGWPLRPNFNNPDTPFAPANVLPARNAVINPKTGQPTPENNPLLATTWIESLTTVPVQVTRVEVPTQGTLNAYDQAIAESAEALNRQVQDLLRQQGSVFQYYKLIGTQWPVRPNAPAFAGGEGSAPESITHKTPGDMVPVFLVNTTMETYFQKGKQPAGPLEQDDRLANGAPPIDSSEVIGTESCVGCHYSAGMCIGFKKDAYGNYVVDPVTGQRTPIFGENSHFGKTGHGAFSWLLQIEGRAKPYTPPSQPPPKPADTTRVPARQPAQMLDVKKYFKARPAAVPPSAPVAPMPPALAPDK